MIACRRSSAPRKSRSPIAVTADDGSRACVLEEAGYIRIVKAFVGRKPQAKMTLTAKGAKAFRDHVDYLEKIISPGQKSRAQDN